MLQARREYGTWLLNVVNGINVRELIFVDESGFNLWLPRTRGRARRGQRAVRIVGGSRGLNFTLILAVSNRRGIIHHSFYEGAINADRFNAWLRDASAAAGNGDVSLITLLVIGNFCKPAFMTVTKGGICLPTVPL